MKMKCLFGHRYDALISVTTIAPSALDADSPPGIVQTTLYDYCCRRCGKQLEIEMTDEEKHIDKEIHSLQSNN